WIPWMEQYPLVRRQARWALHMCAAHISVSEAVRRQVKSVAGSSDKLRVVPNIVDGTRFRPAPSSERVAGQILFVGVVRFCKGVDLLLKALVTLRDQHPEA